jgi:hypothetical protein
MYVFIHVLTTYIGKVCTYCVNVRRSRERYYFILHVILVPTCNGFSYGMINVYLHVMLYIGSTQQSFYFFLSWSYNLSIFET